MWPQIYVCGKNPVSIANTGLANFIDEWSQCDFCFTNFEVKYHNEKGHFQTFQYVFLACLH